MQTPGTGPAPRPALSIGPFAIGRTPWVVGTVTEAATLDRLAAEGGAPCDIVEVRMDAVGLESPHWMDRCREIAELHAPVLLTLRHAREGGAWNGDEAARVHLLREMLPQVNAVDTEIRLGGLAETVRAAEIDVRPVIGSFHDFHATPDEDTLRAVIRDAVGQGAHIVKIAAMLRDASDEARLAALLDEKPDVPLCLLGMGPLGAASRVRLACRGSCLTYGYIDRPAAPGQIAAADLRARLLDVSGQ